MNEKELEELINWHILAVGYACQFGIGKPKIQHYMEGIKVTDDVKNKVNRLIEQKKKEWQKEVIDFTFKRSLLETSIYQIIKGKPTKMLSRDYLYKQFGIS